MRLLLKRAPIVVFSLLVIIGGVILCVGAIAIVYPQSIFLLSLWQNYSPDEYPGYYVVPEKTRSIPLMPELAKNRRSVDAGSLTLFVDPDELYDVNTYKNNLTLIRLNPEDAQGMIVWPDRPGIAADLKAELTEEQINQFRDVFGERLFRSSYEAHMMIANTTPDSATFNSSPEEALAVVTTMIMKPLLIRVTSRGGYQLTVGNIRGLQMGDPELGDNQIIVHLYPNRGSGYHRIDFGEMSQSQIDEVLGSIQFNTSQPSNKALQPTANPLRGLSAAELGR